MRTSAALVLAVVVGCGSSPVTGEAGADSAGPGYTGSTQDAAEAGDAHSGLPDAPSGGLDGQSDAPSGAVDGGPDATPGTDATGADAVVDAGADTTVGDTGGQGTDAATSGDSASDGSGPAPTYVVTLAGSSAFDPWEEVRHVVVDHPGLVDQTHTERTRYTDSRIVDAFGSAEPAPGHLLLHISPGCSGAEPGRVVVLVPGAGSDAQLSWADPPWLGVGLADTLIADGFCVVALTFSHPFGENLNQAIALAAAVEQVRLLTGVPEVSVVGHSKGGVVALAYVSGLAEERGAPFEGDVERLVLLATPIGGTDWSFRHPAFNLPADVWGLPMPGSWDKILEWGLWTDALADSIYGPAFVGVAQLTARWDSVHPLSMVEQDWYTTYEGGWGFVSHSLGIDAAIELGGDFMARLHEHQVPGSIAVSIGAGATPLVSGVALETTGPSDGLVFLQSATQTDLFASPPEVEVLVPLNHWDLVASEAAHAWVHSRLP